MEGSLQTSSQLTSQDRKFVRYCCLSAFERGKKELTIASLFIKIDLGIS